MGADAVDFEKYEQLVSEMPLGKRLPEAVYIHADGLTTLPPALSRMIAAVLETASIEHRWNVIKFAKERRQISLLWYPSFFEEGFPALQSALVVDLETGRSQRRTYAGVNVPILHRKETLLPLGHSAIASAAALTRAAEEVGLFDDPRSIGNRLAWEARLARLRLRVVGHSLVPVDNDDTAGVQIFRHRTALVRHSLSTPMQALWRHGFLCAEQTVFDYGCGRGDDLRALRACGIDAQGWDPHFEPDLPRVEADVVNLGFVLNVIEDPDERREALLGAWKLARQLLVVGVLIGGRTAFERFRLFRDGVLTARGTFQKYFEPTEFRDYLEANLAREPIALAPGIAFVFRNDETEQAFLSRRYSARATAQPTLPRAPKTPSPTVERAPRVARPRPPTKWVQHAELLEAFWETCVTLGRLPEPEEFSRHHEVRTLLGVPATVLRRLIRERGADAIDDATRCRRDDLLVFLALNLFERRRSFATLPPSVRRDVRVFFGSHEAARAAAQAALFSAGDPKAVRDACVEAGRRGLGFLDGHHSLQLHSSLVGHLPPVLRIYVGCAARLYGDLDTADLIKIHIQSGKLSLMTYVDFDEVPLPDLIERVKINLRRQEIQFYSYGTEDMPTQPLYRKSRYIGPSSPHYEEQLAFEGQLDQIKALDLSGFGPSRVVLEALLREAGVTVHGFDLRRTSEGVA